MKEGRNEGLAGRRGRGRIPSQCSVWEELWPGVRAGGARSRRKKPSQSGEGFVEEVAWGGIEGTGRVIQAEGGRVYAQGQQVKRPRVRRAGGGKARMSWGFPVHQCESCTCGLGMLRLGLGNGGDEGGREEQTRPGISSKGSGSPAGSSAVGRQDQLYAGEGCSHSQAGAGPP